MTSERSTLVDVTVQIHQKTAKAILVSDDGDSANGVWLAKSLIEFVEKPGGIAEVTMPEWLAVERRLV